MILIKKKEQLYKTLLRPSIIFYKQLVEKQLTKGTKIGYHKRVFTNKAHKGLYYEK
jgi:hypothetical protein